MGYLFQIVRDIDPKLRMMIDTFTLIGFIYFIRFVYHIFSSSLIGFRTHIWSRLIEMDLRNKYGNWALITGATDGIGLEYARQLASKGLNIILVGRNIEKLDNVQMELLNSTQKKIEVVKVLADFNSEDQNLFIRLKHEIDPMHRDIGILINNAGVMFDSPNRFLDQPESKIWQHVRVNMLAVVMMTRIVLPQMVKKKRGLIVNLSSIAGYQPLPLMGLYSASKIFVEWFSRSLDIEYRQFNIEIQTLIPNYIGTKMTSFSSLLQNHSIFYPNAKTFTANAIATIGRNKLTTGYWCHDLMNFFTKLLVSDRLYRSISWYFLKKIDNSEEKRN
ncbi:hypothetical protein NH340_JMT07890 [Sarcoptes scabiei]|nr:hypothetical protein NH340_JMT07890 [Sarcoptes scabiei]